MYKSITTVIFIFIAINTFSQTFKETSDWIFNNSGSNNNPYVKQQIFYSESKKLIYFIKVLKLPNGSHTYVSFVFDPRKANSVSIVEDINYKGKYNLSLRFSGSTMINSIPIPDTPSNSGILLNNEIIEKFEVKKGYESMGFQITLFSNKEQVVKTNKAIIHLFKTLGHKIKDEDNMF